VSWDSQRPAPRPREERQVGIHVAEAGAVEPPEGAPDAGAPAQDASAAAAPSRDAPAQDSEQAAPGEDAAASDEQAIRIDLADLERIAAERDEYLDALRRLQADFENFKKRIIKQQTEHLQRAAQDLVEKLLPVLDALDLARAHGSTEGDVSGLEQVGNALLAVLQKEGLERIDPLGEPFDPTEAEAVLHEAGDGGEPRVAEVMRAGYRWKGRVLRPAMVKVTG